MRRLLLCLPVLAVLGSLLTLRPAASEPAPARRLVTPETQRAIDRGLAYLARTQSPDGSWTSTAGKKINNTYQAFESGRDVAHVGVTSLAILAFLAGGHVPGRGPYGQVVDRALSFVMSQATSSGLIEGWGTRMYSHAFATLALAEVYGMKRSLDLRQVLEKAIEYTVNCQNATGGWRYVGFSPDSDMSVTVCQVVALRAARNVGLKVPQATIDRALKYVIESAYTQPDEPRGGFRYQPEDIRWNRDSYALAAAGLTTLFQAGLYDDGQIARYVKSHGVAKDPPPRIADTLAYVKHQYQDVVNDTPEHFFFWYGSYYATQAMYLVGAVRPDEWAAWYARIRDQILSIQHRLRDAESGREESFWKSNIDTTNAYATASALLILQFPLDYLPIHQR